MSKKREILLKFIIIVGFISMLILFYYGIYEIINEVKCELEVIIFGSIMCLSAFLIFFHPGLTKYILNGYISYNMH